MAENVPLLTDQEEVSFHDDRSLRIILVGKTGAGKSSTGNTILREKVFHAEMAGNAVTRVCKKCTNTIENTIISVIDTPGFCGSLTTKEMKSEVEDCVKLSVLGPHAFLLVIKVGRVKDEDKNALTSVKKNFGEVASKYTIVLFTHVDQLKGICLQSYIEETTVLRDLIRSCGGRYHSFNNDNTDNSDQVEQLIEIIKRMLRDNGGNHYSNEMFQKAQKKLKFEEICHKAKDIASVAGLAIAGSVGVGAVCAGVGAGAGAVIAMAAAKTAMGAAIGAGVGGGAGSLAGGIAGAKSDMIIEKCKNFKFKKRD